MLIEDLSGDGAQANITDIVQVNPVTQSAPEIDPKSAAGGLALLLGGLAVLRGGREKIAA
ncbi:MAG TPA: hypothetical protein VFD98_00105 [Terracidiphilus sp.]|jgi:hypothetical protein|nr:hypothetical protein [Terracidiphilus sp.]